MKEKISAIKNAYQIGDNPLPFLTIKSIGSKYVTCVSVMNGVHTVKYTITEFYENFVI